jgi:hypothetical protein
MEDFMFNKKCLIYLFLSIFAISLIACGKTKTVISDNSLIENPGEKKIQYVPNGKVKRGEFLILKDQKLIGNNKYFLVQIEGVDTKGWIDEKFVKDGKLKSVTVIKDSDLYMRPTLKSEKVGNVRTGQVAFHISEKDDFVLIQFPGKEAYIQKKNLGEGEMVIKTIAIPGIGNAILTASSQFNPGEGRELEFDPRNVFDGSLQTCWSEGKVGDDGIDEYLTVTFNNPVGISMLSIVNGWAKSEELYKQNNRIAQLRVKSDNGQEITIDLDDNIYDYQKKEVNINGTSFKFIIAKVFKGTDPDTCLSEIKIDGSILQNSGHGDYEGE